MNQYETSDPAGYGPPPVPQTTSIWAILALVFGLLICIPFLAPFLGALFGVIALIEIPASRGRKKGTSLAAGGLVISVVVLALHAYALYGVFKLAEQIQQMPADAAETLLVQTTAGDFDAARAQLMPGLRDRVTDEHFRDFQDRLSQRLGAINDVTLDLNGTVFQRGVKPPAEWQGRQQQSGWETTAWQSQGETTPPAPIPLVLKTDKGPAYAYALTQFGPGETTLVEVSIAAIVIAADDGPWRFPPESITPKPTTQPATRPADGDG